MPHVDHEIGLLIRIRPEEAEEKIVAAYRAARANQLQCATDLGCSESTFHRWIERLGIRKVLDRLRAELEADGTAAPIGRPPNPPPSAMKSARKKKKKARARA